MEGETLNEKSHYELSTGELGTGNDQLFLNYSPPVCELPEQVFDSPGSCPLSWTGSNSTSMAEWLHPKASFLGSLSRFHEVACYDPCAEELDCGFPSSQELKAESVILPDYPMHDPSTSGTTLPIPVSHQRQSSPELVHPVNSEDSLWQRTQRTRGTRTASRRSCPNTCRENAMPSSSLRPSRTGDSAPNLAGHLHRARTKKSYSEGSFYASHFDKPFSLEESTPIDRTTITQDSTAQLEESAFLSSVSFSASSPPNLRMKSRSHHRDDIASPSQRAIQSWNVPHSPPSARPATVLSTSSSSRPFNQPTGVMIEPMTQTMVVSESDTWESTVGWCWDGASTTSGKVDLVNERDSRLEAFGSADIQEDLLGKHEDDEIMTQKQDEMIHDLDQSNARRPPPCPDTQLESLLDKITATTTSELDSSNSRRCLNDCGQQPKVQHQSRGLALSEGLSTKKVPHCFNHESLLVSSAVPKQGQVEELRELVYVVSTEWMQKLTLLRELHLRGHALLQSNLFERAVRTLKQLIRGIFVQTFEDIFALMHLAFAAAFILHWQHDDYAWDSFYDDALKWQHAIFNDDDKIVFLNAMSRWLLPELEDDSMLYCIAPQGSLDCGDKENLSAILRSGEIFKVCIGFLDSKSFWSHFEGHSNYAD